MIEFKEETEKNRYYDPSKGKRISEEILIRKDPLTGKTCRILDKPLPISKGADIEEETKKGGFCPFCNDQVYDVGARDSEVLNDQLLERGEAILLSNISPYADKSLVIRLTEDHHIPLEKFQSIYFTDAFELMLEYLKRVQNLGYTTIMMNYLKPAGSTIVHPHMQLLISHHPLDHQRRNFEACVKYHENYGNNYWEDLIEKEKDSERYIKNVGRSVWKTPFAPGGLEHIRGISLKDLRSLEKEDMKSFSSGIVSTLKYYADQSLNSFNLSISLPPDEDKKKFATVVDIVARSNLDKYYWCDVFALSKLLDESYSNKPPEKIAREAKPFF